MKLIMALQLIWCVPGTTTPSPHFPLPTLCRPIRIFILGSQLTRWELFSTSMSDKKKLPTTYMSVPSTLQSMKKYLFKNTHRNETNKFSHCKAKEVYFFINTWINFNSHIKGIRAMLQLIISSGNDKRWQASMLDMRPHTHML